MFKELLITDGTVTVNLLNPASGFCLQEWRPAVTTLKGGGIWAEAPMSAGRRLRAGGEDNVAETFTLEVRGFKPDALVRDTQNLRRLLETGRQYWIADWSTAPVWLVAQGPDETNPRYSLVMDYRTPEDDDPYFWDRMLAAGFSDFILIVEREPFWRADEPGTGTVTAISAVETYDGRNLGNVDDAGTRTPTTAVDEVFAASHQQTSNITDSYRNGAGANLMDAPPPYNIFTAVTTGQWTCWGIDVTGVTSNVTPFSSLVFDIGTVGAGYTGLWEYSTGGGFWGNLAVMLQDNTDQDGQMTGIAFDTAGVHSVHWDNPGAGWVPMVVNLVNAYWVRYRITGDGAQIPTQQHRNVYAANWAYFEVQDSQIAGDVPAIARHAWVPQADRDRGITQPVAYASRMVMGLRSVSRGENFTPYINLGNEQNPVGVTVTVADTAAFNTEMSDWCATGRCIVVTNPAVAPGEEDIYVTIDYSLSVEYHGEYHLFLRVYQTTGAAGDIMIQVTEFAYDRNVLVWESEWVATEYAGPHLLDFGKVVINSAGCTESQKWGFNINVIGNGVSDITLYDMVLVPVDEWAGDFSDWRNVLETRMGYRSGPIVYYLDVDGVYCPKKVEHYVKMATNDRFTFNYAMAMSGHPIYQANARQRIWLLAASREEGHDHWQSRAHPAFTVRAAHVQRYYSMRGNR